MRTVNCIVCGSEKKRTLAEQTFKDDYLEMVDPEYQRQPRRMVLCEGCGFVYHDPQLDERDQQVLYDKFRDVTYRNETPDAYFDRITSLPRDQSENAQKVDWIRAHMPERIAAGGCLLDVGCGGGVFIHTFLKNCPGWTACGVEPTAAFAALARRRLGKPVVTGGYRPGLFKDQSFDLITVNQVLEHVVDPVAFLRDLRKDLADGGAIYLEVPEISDIGHLPPDHDRFRMQHLWFFSEASLTNVCRKAGYEMIAAERQITVRQRHNQVVLIRPAAAAGGGSELLRDDPARILSISRL